MQCGQLYTVTKIKNSDDSNAHARVHLEPHPPCISSRVLLSKFTVYVYIMKIKTLLVIIAALVLQQASAKFEFTEEWELWKKVRS